MDIDNFKGVYSSRQIDRTSGTPGAAKERKRYWLVWKDSSATVTVQPLSPSLEPAGAKRIISSAELDELYTPEPEIVPSYTRSDSGNEENWERISTGAPQKDENGTVTRSVRRQTIDLDDLEFLSGFEDTEMSDEELDAAGDSLFDNLLEQPDAPGTGTKLVQIDDEPIEKPLSEDEEKAIELERSMRAEFGMALAYLKSGNVRKALILFDELAEPHDDHVPSHKHVFTDFAINLRKSKLLDQALKHHSRAISLSPNDENAHHNIARIYYEMGDIDNAVRYLKKSLELNPRLRESTKFLHYIRKRQKEQSKETSMSFDV